MLMTRAALCRWMSCCRINVLARVATLESDYRMVWYVLRTTYEYPTRVELIWYSCSYEREVSLYPSTRLRVV
eukprot:scaffold33071_cov23-Prasinocladus_malaysianus.AAC.1